MLATWAKTLYTDLNYIININKTFRVSDVFYARAIQFSRQQKNIQMKLMEYQVKLERKYRKTFMDLPLSDTIYQVRSVKHSAVLAFTVDWGRLTDYLPLP